MEKIIFLLKVILLLYLSQKCNIEKILKTNFPREFHVPTCADKKFNSQNK